MDIRAASRDDLDDLVRLGRAMRAESTVRFPEIDRDAVELHLDLVEAFPDRMFMAILRADGAAAGFIGGAAGPYAFSRERHACCELLFVLPEYRGRHAGVRLLRAFTGWAAGQGVGAVELGVSTGIAPRRTARLLETMGFAPLGRTYRKETDACAMLQHSA